jgi:hypothetical protein
MAKRKHGTGSRSKATKSEKRNSAEVTVPPSTPAPTQDPDLDGPKLDAALDPSNVRVKGPEAEKAAAALEYESAESRSGGKAGSLEGLSDVADADSESVDELLEEGNAFEAGVIEGVEGAPDADQSEVKTHEAPEDDVPEEYRNPEQ